MKTSFKKVFDQLNDDLREKNDLSANEKKQLFDETKMYIFIQDFLKKLTPYLQEDEVIQSYLPLTNQDNSAIMTGGIMGMAYARTPDARAYLNTFHTVRGNRLLIFTDQRMIFVVVIDFLEDHTYFSYPYDSIKSFMLKEHTFGYFDWANKDGLRKQDSYYTFDFQAGNHVFTEMLSPEDAQIFQRQLQEIDGLKHVLITDKAKRNNWLDRVFSNVTLHIRLLYGVTILAFLALFIYLFLVLLAAFDIGPLKDEIVFGLIAIAAKIPPLYSLWI